MKKKNMKTLINWMRNHYYVLFILLLLSIPTAYSISRGADLNYWDGAIGNWLATVLGVLCGIPIAVEIQKYNSLAEDKKQLLIELKREKELLLLVKEELLFNYDRLSDRVGNTTDLPLHPFKIDLWSALSDSGEIKYISSRPLLNRIASAYHIVGVVKNIENQCYQASRGATVRFGDKTSAQLLLSDARAFDKQNNDNLQFAINEIDKYIRAH